jgi:hypothetical protein
MLEKPIASILHDVKPPLHSDRGIHCLRDSWIHLMKRHGLTRFLSNIASPPDNSASKGLFDRLSVEIQAPYNTDASWVMLCDYFI